eukprot:tig00020563_g11352.t1
MSELEQLRRRVAELERELSAVKHAARQAPAEPGPSAPTSIPPLPRVDRLSARQVQRYSRQLLMPDVGVQGQLKLASASVLVIGAGGLGSPALMYLAGAGVGRLGIVDFDIVELNNMHRQIIHTEDRVGMPKTESARIAVSRFNSDVECYTDNPSTRYLINDACVIAGKPLVSGSALQMEGQLTVYNHNGGPCYRCLFPTPPPANLVQRCSDGGVLGVVPGVIGCLEALEAIKIAMGSEGTMAGRLLLFDAAECKFRTVKLRPRDPSCAACGECPSVRDPAAFDYAAFAGGGQCPGSAAPVPAINLLDASMRIPCAGYKAEVVDAGVRHVLLDVRPPLQFAICSLPGAVNVPWAEMQKGGHEETLRSLLAQNNLPVYVVCRRGNDSQRAAARLLERGLAPRGSLFSLDGGVAAWADDVDPAFPKY